jgi:23S rRNA pseudouridine955/2504/2580 synthase
MGKVETRTVEPDEAGMRLDRWFRTHFPELGFGHLQKLLRSGQVRVDGGRAKTNTRLEPGQAVRIPPLGASGSASVRPSRPAARRAPQNGDDGDFQDREDGDHEPRHAESLLSGPDQRVPREAGPRSAREGRSRSAVSPDTDFLRSLILYEDDDVIVFNKPPGLAVQGGSGLTRHVDALLEAFRDRKGQKPRLVHRLDRATSGVLVVAKTRLAAQRLAAAFRARSTKKIYWALVRGVPKPKQGRVSTWLAKEEGPEGDRMRIARHGAAEASHAVSLYSVVDQAGQKLAWLTMKPVTGRTHQLRAHAAHIGHPIIGDDKYFRAEPGWELPGGIQNRLHLHARRIVIPHPSGRGVIDVTAPLPPHMQQSWNLLGFDVGRGDKDEPSEAP